MNENSSSSARAITISLANVSAIVCADVGALHAVRSLSCFGDLKSAQCDVKLIDSDICEQLNAYSSKTILYVKLFGEGLTLQYIQCPAQTENDALIWELHRQAVLMGRVEEISFSKTDEEEMMQELQAQVVRGAPEMAPQYIEQLAKKLGNIWAEGIIPFESHPELRAAWIRGAERELDEAF